MHNSAGGSLVMYLVDIVGIDPIQHNLIFERFISRARARSSVVDGVFYIDGLFAPDVDLDICFERRSEVIEYLKQKYVGRVCQLSTHQTLKTKILIKECGKIVGGFTEDDMKVISDYIPSLYGKVFELEKAQEADPRFKDFCDQNPKVIDVAYKLRKVIKTKGSHASAYVVGFDPLDEFMPCEKSSKGEVISCYDMETAQELAIKLDLLGLKGVTLIENVLNTLGLRRKDIDVNDNPDIYKFFENLKSGYGLFQISGDCNLGVAQQVKPKNISELSDVIALARPGALAYVEDYVGEIEANKDKLQFAELQSVLEDTRFIPIYQEQMMSIAHKVFGFTLEEADILRKIVGKKKVKEVKEWKGKIYDQAEKKGLGKNVADFFWKILDESSNYSFNRSIGAGAKVTMADGTEKAIEEVKVGEKVTALCTKSKKDHTVEVKDTFSHKADLYRVELQNGMKIDCSMEHKFLCEDMVMRPLKEIIHNNLSIVTKTNNSQIFKTHPLGRQISYDLEVDHPDHNFYAEGLVTSNSHSTAYASLAALTVYLKFHYPKEFFLECLKLTQTKTDSVDEVALIHQEVKDFGFQILPPDISKPNIDFSIEEGGIRYGLGCIKGIAGKSVGKLKDFIKSDAVNKFEVFQAAKDAGLTVGIMSALIQAGALSSSGDDRTHMVMECQLWSLLTPREKVYCLQHGKEYSYDLVAMVKDIYEWKKDNGKQLVRDGRQDTLRRNFEKYKNIYFKNKKYPDFADYVYERQLLGFSYTQKLKDIFSRLAGYSLMSIDEIAMEEPEIQVECVAEVLEAKKSTAKKSGKKYLRLKCCDETGVYDFMLFGAAYHQWADKGEPVPSEGSYVYLKGRKGEDIVWVNNLGVQDEKIYMKMSELKQKL